MPDDSITLTPLNNERAESADFAPVFGDHGLRIAAVNDFLCFLRYTDPNYVISRHIEFVSKYLMLVEQGVLKRLIINLPPRHGKSELVSKRFVSWFIGKNPGKSVVVSTYGAELSLDFTRWVRNQFNEMEYQSLFPKLSLARDSKAGNRWSTTKGNTVIGAGAGGAITGRGGELLIIDDIVKNSEEARSRTVLEKHWNWYRETFRTRLHPGGAIVVIMTRWVKGDLVGRLLEQMKEGDGEEWFLLRLPAIAEQGDLMEREPGTALWPERYNLTELQKIRSSIGEKAWTGLYQQSPVDILERVFDEPILEDPPSVIDAPIIGCLDPAFEGSDWTALVFGCRINGKFYVLFGDVWQTPVDETYNQIVQWYNEFSCGLLLVESNAAQSIVGKELKKRGLNVYMQASTKSKFIRITNIRQYWLNIRFSNKVTSPFMKQVMEYTDFVDVPDDAPDALSGMIERVAGGVSPGIISDRRIVGNIPREVMIDPKIRKVIAEISDKMFNANGFIEISVISQDTGLPKPLVKQVIEVVGYVATMDSNRYVK